MDTLEKQDYKACVICGNLHNKNGDTCSRSCGSKLSHLTRGKRVKLICPICNDTFEVECRDRNKRKTCGNPECNKKYRSIKMSGEGNHQYGLKGELNASYQGGRRVDSKGYVRVLCHDHPNADKQGYVKEHILIMSRILRRPLNTIIECVHHKDENKQNNEPSNLELKRRGIHTSHHNRSLFAVKDGCTGRFIKVVKRKPIKIEKEVL